MSAKAKDNTWTKTGYYQKEKELANKPGPSLAYCLLRAFFSIKETDLTILYKVAASFFGGYIFAKELVRVATVFMGKKRPSFIFIV